MDSFEVIAMLDPAQRKRLLSDNRARFGFVVVVLMVFAAIAAPLIATQDPLTIDLVEFSLAYRQARIGLARTCRAGIYGRVSCSERVCR